MRVLTLAPHLEPVDGIQRSQLEIARSLKARHHDNVLAYARGGANEQLWQTLTDGQMLAANLTITHHAARTSARSLRDALRVSRKWRYDLVCSHRLDQVNFAAAVALARRVPLLLHAHNDPPRDYRWNSLGLAGTRAVSAVITPSEFTREAWRSIGVPSDRLQVVRYGVDVERFKPANDAERREQRRRLGIDIGAFVVAYVGRVERSKGVDVLAHAFAHVATVRDDVHLLIVGSANVDVQQRERGELRKELEQILHASNWTSQSAVLDVERFYQAADLVVVPSVWNDPAALVIFEAMASGVPVIATKVGGVPEAFPREWWSDLLVPPGDPTALAARITRLADDTELRRSYGDSGRALIMSTRAEPIQGDRITEMLSSYAQERSWRGP